MAARRISMVASAVAQASKLTFSPALEVRGIAGVIRQFLSGKFELTEKKERAFKKAILSLIPSWGTTELREAVQSLIDEADRLEKAAINEIKFVPAEVMQEETFECIRTLGGDYSYTREVPCFSGSDAHSALAYNKKFYRACCLKEAAHWIWNFYSGAVFTSWTNQYFRRVDTQYAAYAVLKMKDWVQSINCTYAGATENRYDIRFKDGASYELIVE